MLPNRLIFFILSDKHYLYKNLLIRISNYFLNKNYKTVALIRDIETSRDFIKEIESSFTHVFSYGSNYYNFKNINESGYLKNKYRFIRSINSLKAELLDIVDRNTPSATLSFDSWDPAIEILSKYRPGLKIYYLQNVAIISRVDRLTLRQKYDNLISILFCGFRIIRRSNNPPFNNKRLIYLLWSRLWSNNIDESKYNIQYLPKILIDHQIEKGRNNDCIKSILIILNKRRNVGNLNWEVYANFYKKFFEANNKYNPVFKVHPDEDLNYCKNYFYGYDVIKQDININKYDLVLSHWSTFIFDASLCKIPLILINPDDKFDFKKWRLSHYPIIVKDISSLKIKIRDIENNKIDIQKVLNEFIKVSLGDNPSTSIDRLFMIITKNSN